VKLEIQEDPVPGGHQARGDVRVATAVLTCPLGDNAHRAALPTSESKFLFYFVSAKLFLEQAAL